MEKNDGTEFEFCATYEQRYGSYNRLRIGLVTALLLAIIGKSIVWGIVAILPLVWTVLFHREIGKLKKTVSGRKASVCE